MSLFPSAPGRFLRAGAAELLGALYPPLCWLCRRRLSVDGLGCELHALAPCAFSADEPRCVGCALRLPEGLTLGRCARCRRVGRGYGRLVAHGPYRQGGALREWILALKHGGRVALARPLAALLARAWGLSGGPPAGVVLTSVPLHPLRRLERGFDQADLLARALGELLDLQAVAALRRVRWTPAQGAPGSVSRQANVRAAFASTRAARRVAGRSVWLVDDVVTSGATVRACAEELRRAGAAEVSVLALARVDLGQSGGVADRGSTILAGRPVLGR